MIIEEKPVNGEKTKQETAAAPKIKRRRRRNPAPKQTKEIKEIKAGITTTTEKTQQNSVPAAQKPKIKRKRTYEVDNTELPDFLPPVQPIIERW